MSEPVRYRIRGADAKAISAEVERAVRTGRLAPGDALPTVRALAADLGVSPVTVASAYRTLRERGLVVTAGRRGTSVASRPPLPVRTAAPVPAGARDVSAGYPDPRLLPPLRPALARIESPRGAPGAAVLPALREVAAAAFRADGVPAEALTVVGGAMDAIERVLLAHLRPGDRVAVEDPGYPNLLDLLGALGLVAEPVPLDRRGMAPAELARALGAGAAAVVVTPRAQNPTGAAFDADRAGALVRVLRRHPDVLLVEDDHAAAVAGAPAHTLVGARPARWAVVRSVSKTLGPDLRLALLAADATTLARVEGRRLLGTGWVSGLLQQTVAALYGDPATRTRLASAAARYAARRHALVAALGRRGIAAYGDSGLNVWVPVADEPGTMARLREAGWAASPGSRYRTASPPGIRLTIAALPARDADSLAAAVATAIHPPTQTYAS